MKHLLSKTVAVLTVLLLTGCQWNDNPVRTSLIIDTSDMILSVGESATRTATSEARTYEVTYTSSNPSVATVDQNGKVTAMSVGETIIKVYMPETLESWYAATSAEYKVIVKDVPAEKMQDVDKSTPLTLVAQADGKITVTFNNGIVQINDEDFLESWSFGAKSNDDQVRILEDGGSLRWCHPANQLYCHGEYRGRGYRSN